MATTGTSSFSTIADVHGLLAERAISPSEVVDEFAARIAARDPAVKAWAHLDLDAARQQALTLDTRMDTLADIPPLFGIPYGAKDIMDTANLPTEAGSRVLAGNRPTTNASVVDRLTLAGAVMLGKTTTTEFAHMGGPPATGNPWDLRHTPGGSSSGSAAAVAACMAPFALGSQTAGSLSRPAAYNGLTVLKASFGRVSKAGVVPVAWTLDHISGLTHSVEDSVLLYNAIAGPDPLDPFTQQLPFEPLSIQAGAGYTIGVVDHPYFSSASGDVQQALEDAMRVLGAAGVRVVRITPPEGFDQAAAAQQVVMQCEMAAVHADWYARDPSLYTPEVRAYLAQGRERLSTEYLLAMQTRLHYRQAFQAMFADIDILATPAAPSAAPAGLGATGSPMFNYPFTSLGVPTLVVPTGFDATGHLPVAMQLVAPYRQEQRLVDVGCLFQLDTDWHLRRPALA